MTTPLCRAGQAVAAAELALDRAVDAGSALRPAIQALKDAVGAWTREQVAGEIEARIRTWPGMSQQAEAANNVRVQAARIARTGTKEST